jgi:polyferredoxin
MDKVGSPRGLIRYWTEHAMLGRWTSAQILRHALRPRVLIYSAVLLVIVSVFVGTLLTRTPFKMDVIRDRGAMGREVEDGMIENVYRLQIMNTDEDMHHFRLSVSGIDSIHLDGAAKEIELGSTESRAVPVRVRVDAGAGQKGSNKIWFTLQVTDGDELEIKEKAVFFIPR